MSCLHRKKRTYEYKAHKYWFWQDAAFKLFYYAYYFKYSIAFRYTSNYWNLLNNDYILKITLNYMQFLEINYRWTGKETVNTLITIIKSCQFNYSWGYECSNIC